MLYALLIYSDEAKDPQPGSEGFDEFFRGYMTFTEDVDKGARDDTLETLLGGVEATLTADESWDDLAYETIISSTDEAQSDIAPEAGRRVFVGEVGYRTAIGDATKVVVL